jgi:hypothetical protein
MAHPFWKIGAGWTKAKDLSAGGAVRTIEGAALIDLLSDGEPAQAYNLEIADFGTYFVGKTGLLVHDASPIRDLPRKAPGLLADQKPQP